MANIIRSFLFWGFTFLLVSNLYGQPNLRFDFTKTMSIPDIVSVEASETHLYILSESEGLIVFRAYQDSLQWLYSSTGMQRRGNRLSADARFAYLFGNGKRLTVIEPTSLLGVYSSTVLPKTPITLSRLGNILYLAIPDEQLAYLKLDSPESVDSDITPIDENRFLNQSVLDLTSDNFKNLYVLTSSGNIEIYNRDLSSEIVSHLETVELDRDLNKIFLVNDELYGTQNSGQIYRISSNGQTDLLGTVSEQLQKIENWENQLAVRTENGQIWVKHPDEEFELWKESKSGNYFAVSGKDLWVSEFNQISPVVEFKERDENETISVTAENNLIIKKFDPVTLPFPKPLLLPIELENKTDKYEITFNVDPNYSNAEIRGYTFYWHPNANQTGQHRFEITATSSGGQSHSQIVNIDVRPFNSPPRFTPTRPLSIVVNEQFGYKVNAVDPDGFDQNLIRYLGVDMPSDARMDEQTGNFTWTPSVRQVGKHTFRVIATDQFGAAASQDFEINVIDVSDENIEEIEPK